jgi:peroxin-14
VSAPATVCHCLEHFVHLLNLQVAGWLADCLRPLLVLQDPSVASSPVEKKVAFLQAKNLTQEEISAALARIGEGAPVQAYPPQAPSAVAQPPQYYGQQYPPQYPPYGWQQPPPQPIPRRDWRDWFIMATVVSGVSYGLFSLGKVCSPGWMLVP